MLQKVKATGCVQFEFKHVVLQDSFLPTLKRLLETAEIKYGSTLSTSLINRVSLKLSEYCACPMNKIQEVHETLENVSKIMNVCTNIWGKGLQFSSLLQETHNSCLSKKIKNM